MIHKKYILRHENGIFVDWTFEETDFTDQIRICKVNNKTEAIFESTIFSIKRATDTWNAKIANGYNRVV